MTTNLHAPTTRRAVLAGALGLAALPLKAQTIPANPDVVVVGAGSAGLAAARTLIQLGKSVVVVEAAGRVGGRAQTESETFGVPFDYGCSWISSAKLNPYADLARQWNFDLRNQSGAGEAFFVNGKRANSAQRKKYDRSWSNIQAALSKAGRAGRDVSAASVIPAKLEYSGISQSWIGPMDWGVDFEDLSTMDNWNAAESSPNLMVRQGHGALVARLSQGLPVKLNAPVTAIDWSGDGVKVETSAGTLRAKACIITVSTGVLASSAIRFRPNLLHWKQQAIDNVPMGLLVKIALQFDGEKFGLVSDNWLTYWVPEKMPAQACYFLTWPFEFDLMIGFAGGRFGWELSKAGQKAAVDFALGEAVKIIGSNARKHFIKGYMTDWASNPLTLGAYAAARPGHHAARSELEQPVADRLFFAGEAMAGELITLCGGAYASGQAVAKKVANHV